MHMVKNHLRMAFRILKKQKLTAVINIIGLGIGLSFFILLAAYVRDDLTFDRFHEKADQTYILMSEFRDRFIGCAHHFIAEMLEDEFTEVEPGSTLRCAMHSQIVRREDRLIVKDFLFTESGFFDVFSFALNAGDSMRLLSDPYQVVITSTTAQAFFSRDDPLGQTLSIQIGDSFQDFTVVGIVAEIPGNSSIQFDGILHYSHVFDAYQIDRNNNDFVTLPMFTTTVLDLSDEKQAVSLRTKLPAFSDRIYGAMWKRVNMAPPKQGFDLIKLTDYHRGDVFIPAFASPGHPAFSWVLSGIAFLILALACVNSINLLLAQGFKRLKEIGIRRVVGARKKQIIGQLTAESLFTGLVALVVGFAAATLLIPPFNTLTGKRLADTVLLHPQTLFVVIAAVFAVCLLIGLILSQSLSRFQVGNVFRGRFISMRKSRLSLIVFQFTVSLVFIIGTLIITRQLHFMTTADLGYDPSRIVRVHTQVPGELAPEGESLLKIFRNELANDSRVLAVSADSGSVGTGHGSVTRRYDKDGIEHTVEAFMIAPDYMKTLNIPVILGRDFSQERLSDIREGFLVNEAFLRDFELANPVGKRFSDFATDKFPAEYTFDPIIIGVVRDFHVFSLHVPIGPMAFGPRGFPPIQRFSNILVKVREGEESAVLKRLEAIWAEVRPDLPFDYSFLEDDLAWEYRRERDWGRIVGWTTGFALIIACMGLFGLTAVMVARRTKETSIRMVLGARASDILMLFMKDILKWVLIANFLALPIALIAARRWLNQFAYRVDIGIWMFVLAALLSFLAAGLTVSWHTVRAALSSPVQGLRYE